MNNDLISREALKKAIEGIVVGGEERLKDYYENGSKADENAWIGGIYDAWELCVIAPTVYPICEDKACKYRANERPQGKWVTESKPFDDGLGDDVLVMTCSICKKSFVYRGTTSNFCPNCGADMRGDKE